MIGDYKIVEYDKYCYKCKNKDVSEGDDPCHECLNESGRIDSHKPINFEEK